MNQEREIDRFQVKDEDGTVYEVTEYQEFTEHRTVNGKWIRTDGLKRLNLDDGGHLNRIDENTFKVVATGKTASRLPPRPTRPNRRNPSAMAV